MIQALAYAVENKMLTMTQAFEVVREVSCLAVNSNKFDI